MLPRWLLPFIIWSCHISALEENNSHCTCVLAFLCDDIESTLKDGLIGIRLKDDSCPHYLERCCKQENMVTKRSPTIPKQTGCGHRHPDGIAFRILDDTDNEAQFGEFPWMVAVFRKMRNETRHSYKCGGSLIHPQVVLTAAHCVHGSGNTFKIRAGEWDSMTTNEVLNHEDREVVSVVMHSQFSKKYFYYDIALLFLDDPVTIGEHISPICLPPQNAVASGKCIVTGWGKDKFDKKRAPQVILKKIELPVMDREACQSAFRETRLTKAFKLHQTFMCAGGEEGKDACTGDGGGPLVCRVDGEENRYQQAGIVSWGIGCGSKGVPGAYADVARFRNWIEQQLQRKNLQLGDK